MYDLPVNKHGDVLIRDLCFSFHRSEDSCLSKSHSHCWRFINFLTPSQVPRIIRTPIRPHLVTIMSRIWLLFSVFYDIARFVQTWGILQWTAFLVMGKVLFYDFDLSSCKLDVENPLFVGHAPIWGNHRLSTSFCTFTPWCPIFGAVLEPNLARITFWLPSCQMSGWHLGSHGSPCATGMMRIDLSHWTSPNWMVSCHDPICGSVQRFLKNDS